MFDKLKNISHLTIKRIIFIIAVIAVVSAVYLSAEMRFFVGSRNSAPVYNRAVNSGPASSANLPGTPPSIKLIVIYTDRGYSPENLQVKAGATVIFQNNSSRKMWTASGVHPSHKDYSGTSLSEHCSSLDNNAFDACEGAQPGKSWSFQFNKIGTWNYHNHLYPDHAGVITVVN